MVLARVGLHPWFGSGNVYHLLYELIQHLSSNRIIHISHIADPNSSSLYFQGWKSSDQLDIPKLWRQAWKSYIYALFKFHIHITIGNMNLSVHILGMVFTRAKKDTLSFSQIIFHLNSSRGGASYRN